MSGLSSVARPSLDPDTKKKIKKVTEDIRVLFDPDHEYSQVWPTHKALMAAVRAINETFPLETYRFPDFLGWVYQFFNVREKEEIRRKTRGKPRTPHELAVINQFYTPDWIVKFLVDNTLARRLLDTLWRNLANVANLGSLIQVSEDLEKVPERWRVRGWERYFLRSDAPRPHALILPLELADAVRRGWRDYLLEALNDYIQTHRWRGRAGRRSGLSTSCVCYPTWSRRLSRRTPMGSCRSSSVTVS